MWMQKSVESASFSSGHLHDRNHTAAAPSATGSRVYSGSAMPTSAAGSNSADASDWKHRIVESGQWLGGKVIEYGGKLTRGPTADHATIADHYAQQVPRNDGRANWMADIRSSSTSAGAAGGRRGAGGTGYTGGYQNDFATERPKVYAEYSRGYTSSAAVPGQWDDRRAGGDSARRVSTPSRAGSARKEENERKSSRRSKKNKKKKKSDKKKESASESEREDETEEQSESSAAESADARRRARKVEAKKKHKTKKKTRTRTGFYSEESGSEDACSTDNASADLSVSSDDAKPLSLSSSKQAKAAKKQAKAKKSKKDKPHKKSRTQRQSIASTDEEAASRSTSTRKAKTRSSKKAVAVAAGSTSSVDLLGVDLDAHLVVQPPASGCSGQQHQQHSIFDAPHSQNPLQDLTGLSFVAPVQDAALSQPAVCVNDSALARARSEEQSQHRPQSGAFQTNMLPENNIVDFSTLASETKKTLSANPKEKRTLNDLQKARGSDQPTPVMAMPVHGRQPQNASGSMMQLNMKQLQITDGATSMPQQMYTGMQMHQMPMQPQMHQMPMQPPTLSPIHPQMMAMQHQMMMIQPPMTMMAQPQMMSMPTAQQQQVARGRGGMTSPASTNSSDAVL
ncbi:unnamed protein product [Hyaloperonospora brassicae]|uniref:Uncharacterized protein n=1 Tax=Hyaloperonospora brassicae TaxID=162125 RepID=A0AAV0TD25_HYABA|nr:unnamed protein product [Hyaloperonospora brassicae]